MKTYGEGGVLDPGMFRRTRVTPSTSGAPSAPAPTREIAVPEVRRVGSPVALWSRAVKRKTSRKSSR